MKDKATYKITVAGLVQGIGFRPFIAELAEKLQLAGQVKNLGGIVEIIVSGEKQAVDEMIHRLKCVTETQELPGCRIESLQVDEIFGSNWWMEDAENVGTCGNHCLQVACMQIEDVPASRQECDKICGIECEEMIEKWKEKLPIFRIVESGSTREVRRFLPVDLPTCDRCAAEMHDVSNRRYRYPFISCTACGPRFSIQKAVPYDRETITMDDFPMCDACREEYTQKGNIRRHAQTIACKDCGPRLRYAAMADGDKSASEELREKYICFEDEKKAISEAVQALKNGKIGAVKDIGGYHFAFSPLNGKAAKRLRAFKNRDKKPFAVMFLNLDEVREYCEVSEKEAAILSSSARPIVLLKKKQDFVSEICGESDRIGALLPCNPLQFLLLEETGPLVMTSGNRGGEPIIISDEEMMQYIGNGIDFMLTHDRKILTPLDDSIYQVEEYPQLIRRARGLVPEPISMKRKLKQDTFAAGGDLKAAFALGREELVYMSQYFGDLEDVRCMESRQRGRVRMEHLLEIHPEVTIGDLHPAYVSAQDTMQKVQHHHAHAASVIAEHGLEGKVLGIACDGTGFGTDGTIWGSEFLLCEEEKMKRAGHFSSVKLVGGDAGAKQADLTLYSYMLEAGERGLDGDAFFKEWESSYINMQLRKTLHSDAVDMCEKQFKSAFADDGDVLQIKQKLKLQEMAWKQNINTVYSSSMGRLFDAAAALLDICYYNSYEGECAILLEQAAHRGMEEWMDGKPVDKPIQVECEKVEHVWQADSVKLLMDLYQLKSSCSKEVLAYLFHHAVASAIVELADGICKEENVKQVALSGGTFINRILLKEVMTGLLEKGLQVYINEKVPCGDGGIALGQMYLATF